METRDIFVAYSRDFSKCLWSALIQNRKSKTLAYVANVSERMAQSKILMHFMVTKFSERETASRNFG